MQPRTIGTILFGAVLVLSACSKGREDADASPAAMPGPSAKPVTDDMPLPPNHPPMPAQADPHTPGAKAAHPSGGARPALNIPAEVSKTWRHVELEIGSGSAAPTKQRVAVGADANAGPVRVRVVAYVPDFRSGDGAVTSAGNSPQNPAALVEVSEGGKPVAEGWVFEKYPDFNTYQSNRVKVRLLRGLKE